MICYPNKISFMWILIEIGDRLQCVQSTHPFKAKTHPDFSPMSITCLIQDEFKRLATQYVGRFDDLPESECPVYRIGGSNLHSLSVPLLKGDAANFIERLTRKPMRATNSMEQGKRLEREFLRLLFPNFVAESLLVRRYRPGEAAQMGKCFVDLVATPDLLYQPNPDKDEWTLVEIKSKVSDWLGVKTGVKRPETSHKTQVCFYTAVLRRLGINVTNTILQYIGYDSGKRALKNLGTFKLTQMNPKTQSLVDFIEGFLPDALCCSAGVCSTDSSLTQIINHNYTCTKVAGLPGFEKLFLLGQFIELHLPADRSNELDELLPCLLQPVRTVPKSNDPDSTERCE